MGTALITTFYGVFLANMVFLPIAGKLKRTSSSIRKLQRPQNKGMDLTRMSDIAGTRVILKI